MKNRKTSNGGYIGLVMLLVGIAIMAFIIVRTDVFSPDGRSMIEQGNDAVDEAEEARRLMEERNRKLLEQYDYAE